MADDARTCTNCGNAQATGDFCEKCGTRLPAAGASAAAAASPQAAQAAPQYAAQPPYAAPKGPNPFQKLFDPSFQGYVTRGSLSVLWVSSLVLLGVFFVLSLIFFSIAADQMGAFWCIGIFATIVLLPLVIGWIRVTLELTMTVSKLREDMDKATEAKAGKKAS